MVKFDFNGIRIYGIEVWDEDWLYISGVLDVERGGRSGWAFEESVGRAPWVPGFAGQ